MILNIYSVFDRVNKSYGPLTLANNNEVAIRNARVSISNDLQTQSIANDLVLYNLGCYDLESGVIKPSQITQVICLSDLVPKDDKIIKKERN